MLTDYNTLKSKDIVLTWTTYNLQTLQAERDEQLARTRRTSSK